MRSYFEASKKVPKNNLAKAFWQPPDFQTIMNAPRNNNLATSQKPAENPYFFAVNH
jgi:hypothetical protein